MTNTLYHPGQIVPTSGQYERVNVYGHRMGIQVTCTKGERFPPALHHGQTYLLVDPTDHIR